MVKFVKTDTLDNSDLQKLVTRMMELGVLTPEQGIKTINSGSFPNENDLISAQEKFLKNREDGYYMPLVNSINLKQEAELDTVPQKTNNKETIQKTPVKPNNKTATTSAPSGGRPIGTSKAKNAFSRKNIIEATKLINEFEFKAFAEFAEKYGVEDLENNKKDLVSSVCESIIVSKEKDQWELTLAAILDDFDSIQDLGISTEILDIASKHQLDDLSAAILYHSNKIIV
jgi:hypothetical protein